MNMNKNNPITSMAACHRVILVGDRFGGFAEIDSVRTVSRFHEEIAAGMYDACPTLHVECGQGLVDGDLQRIRTAIAGHGLAKRIIVSPPAVPAGRQLVHKHQQQNVLLTRPKRISLDTYASALTIHGDNELLHDHQTGLHVQGMVVTEAVRQMFLALFEVRYRQRWPELEFYIVWNSVDIAFQNFVFPLPATVTATVTQSDLTDAEKLGFEVRIDMAQGGRPAATALVSFSAFAQGRIARIERRRAESALAAIAAGDEEQAA
jgi:A-factor biosynthesis hotdog domain